MKTNYDVIIIGASIAGLECAKNLAGSNLSVLVVEKKHNIGEKVCAEGIFLKDMEYIPKEDKNSEFKKFLVHYKNKSKLFPDKGVLTTINRKNFLQKQFNELKKFKNIEFLLGANVLKIASKNSIRIDKNKILNYRFLVGADGSTSMVRNYLNLSSKKIGIAIQYSIPKQFHNFELCIDEKLFGTGYLWIFPNRNYTYIGCGSDVRFIDVKALKQNLDNWIKQKNINLSGADFQAATINYDYRGYKFDNIFLTGDAAGLCSGITGEGMYAAFLSGKQAAKEILGENGDLNLIHKWLKKKKKQEKYMVFLKSYFLRKISFSIIIRMLSSKMVQKIFIRTFVK